MKATSTPAQPSVAELQGLYGPFTFSERLLQKIWLRGDFDRTHLRTLDGRRVSLLHPGRWNLLGGPDFKGARLSFDGGAEWTGDVEMHLHAEDWAAHGHAKDPAYDHVGLHVVLFVPPAGQVTTGAHGRPIPVVALLPLLHHDLEEYAAEDAVETLASRPASQILETLGVLPPDELAHVIAVEAVARWRQKVHFARLRIQRLGWSEACHQTALEILGYRFNRAPMLRIAGAMPLAAWSQPTLSADALFEKERAGWSLHGLRPANHPRHRLSQYASWVAARPDWPEKLAAVGVPAVPAGATTGEVRRAQALTAWRARWSEDICAGRVGGTRFDNLVCDGFLPLRAARAGETETLHGCWYHWFSGDLPPVLLTALRQLGIFAGRLHPACHGPAQGLLGWVIARERGAAGSAGRGA